MIGAIMQIMGITRIHTELSPPELPQNPNGAHHEFNTI